MAWGGDNPDAVTSSASLAQWLDDAAAAGLAGDGEGVRHVTARGGRRSGRDSRIKRRGARGAVSRRLQPPRDYAAFVGDALGVAVRQATEPLPEAANAQGRRRRGPQRHAAGQASKPKPFDPALVYV